MAPRPYLAYYPALYPQDKLKHGVALLSQDGSDHDRFDVAHANEYQALKPRTNYETANAIDLSQFQTVRARLGDLVQARSGDKGANINIGFFVRKPEHYPWLQSFMTRDRMRQLMGQDWRPDFFIERCEFQNIHAVHFVIYGPLGRGVSSCRLLDSLGKGFADFIRDRVVDVPKDFLEDIASIKAQRLAWTQL